MRTVYAGFRTEGFGPFVYLFQKIGREKYDLDLQPAPLFNREGAEADLLAGRVNFLLGQHFTPVASTARDSSLLAGRRLSAAHLLHRDQTRRRRCRRAEGDERAPPRGALSCPQRHSYAAEDGA